MRDIITQTKDKIKEFLQLYYEEIGVSLIIVLVALSSYYLGRISVSFESEHPQITIEEVSKVETSSDQARLAPPAGEADSAQVVATKNGKRYYYPWCPTVAKLSDSAKRHFASAAEAMAAGLTPAKNCAGMK